MACTVHALSFSPAITAPSPGHLPERKAVLLQPCCVWLRPLAASLI